MTSAAAYETVAPPAAPERTARARPVRVAELTRDLYGRAHGDRTAPRIAYVQHASDPIARWSPNLLVEEPDWIHERAGNDVAQMSWTSFATFWQLTTDMMAAGSTPAGHGHRYQQELVPAGAGVLGLDPTADYTAIRRAIEGASLPV